MGGGGSNSTNTIQRADPWSGAVPYLRTSLEGASDLFDSGGFAPSVYGGPRVAGFGDTSRMGQDMILDAAGQPTTSGVAQGALTRMMDPEYTSAQLDAVKENALGSAIPAATAAFSGSGMLNSTMAMDTVGRAATEAIAPYEYGAYEGAANRALSAAGLAPSADRGIYLPGTMVSGVGASQDAMSQAQIDADRQAFLEGADPELRNLRGFADFVLPISGQGGSTSSTQEGGGPSTLARLGGGVATGLGTYGSLLATPLAPWAAPIGIGAGLLGFL